VRKAYDADCRRYATVVHSVLYTADPAPVELRRPLQSVRLDAEGFSRIEEPDFCASDGSWGLIPKNSWAGLKRDAWTKNLVKRRLANTLANHPPQLNPEFLIGRNS
jgi:hypothetical protein